MKNSRLFLAAFSIFMIALVASCAVQQRTGNFALVLDEASISKMLKARGSDTSDSTQISLTIQLKGEDGSGVDQTQTVTTSLTEAKTNPVTVTFSSIPLNITFDVIVSAYIDGELFYYGTSHGSSSAGDVNVAVKMSKLVNTRYGIWDNTGSTRGITFVRKPSQYQGVPFYLQAAEGHKINDYCFDSDGNYYVVSLRISSSTSPVLYLYSDNKVFLKKFNPAYDESGGPTAWYVNCSNMNPLKHVAVDYANGNVYVMAAEGNNFSIRVFTKDETMMGEFTSDVSGGDFTVYDNFLYLAGKRVYENISLTLSKYKVTIDEGTLSFEQQGDSVDIYSEPDLPLNDLLLNDMIVLDGNLYVIAGMVSASADNVLSGGGPVFYGLSRGMLYKINMDDLSVQKTVGYKNSPFKIKARYGYKPEEKYYTVYKPDGDVDYGSESNYAKIYSISSLTDTSCFANPVKFAAVKPGKLVIADDGIFFYEKKDVGFYDDVNRFVTVDLETFAMTVENTVSQLNTKTPVDCCACGVGNTGYDTKTVDMTYQYRDASGKHPIPSSSVTVNEGNFVWHQSAWNNP